MLTGFVFFSTNNWLCCGNLYYAHYFRLCNMSGDILPGAALWETAGESNRNRARYFFFFFSRKDFQTIRRNSWPSVGGGGGLEERGQTHE